MAAFVKFQQFVEDLGAGVHNLKSTGDTLKIYLTDNTPDPAAHAIKGDLAGITEQFGYVPADIQNDYAQTTGTAKLTGVDVTFTASGGSFGPFRYAVLYNDTPTSPVDPLIAYWDYGSSTTITDGNDFTVDFGTEIFSLA